MSDEALKIKFAETDTDGSGELDVNGATHKYQATAH